MKIRIMPYGTVNFIQHEVPYAVRAVSEIMGYSTYRVFFSKRFPTLLQIVHLGVAPASRWPEAQNLKRSQ